MTALTIRGDAAHLPLSDNSVDLIVTSPPFWGLRAYQDKGVTYAGQVGSEGHPQAYIRALLDCTREWVRVLKPSGSIFVNLGDRYRSRSLAGFPWRYALGCTDELKLTLRAELVWAKSNRFIDSKAAGRVRRTHETWFHLSPTPRPYEDVEQLREAPDADYQQRPQYRRAVELFEAAGLTERHLAAVRSVGVIDSAGGAVRSGGSWQSDAGILAAEVRAVLGSYYRELCGNSANPIGTLPGSVWEIDAEALKLPKHLAQHHAAFPAAWPLRFIQGWCPPDGTVLDPFGGTGTTVLCASVLGRVGVSVDLSHDYSRLASWRMSDPAQRAKAMRIEKPPVQIDGQIDIFGGAA